MRRRKRWIIWLSCLAAVAVALWVTLRIVVPMIIERQVAAVFKNAGVEDVKFDLIKGSLWQTHLTAIASGEWLLISDVSIDYSPTRVLKGDIDSIRIRDGRMTLSPQRISDLTASRPATRPSPPRLPVRRFELQAIDLTIEGDSAAEIRGLAAKFEADSLSPLTTPPGQFITAEKIKFAGQEFSHVHITFEARSADEIRVTEAQLTWADGRISAAPFIVAMSTGSIEAVLSAEHVDLAQVLAMISQGRATGTGKISGQVPVKTDGKQLALGEGFFEADNPGTLRLGDSIDQFAKILDQTDPRFAQDAKMQQVKQQILEAMADFEYDHLRADLKRETDDVLVVVTIQGRGRIGARQELNLTLNFRGFEHGINTYLAGRSRVLELGK